MCVYMAVGTSVAAIVALLVCSGGNKVSTKDAFTLFENNTGWDNGAFFPPPMGLPTLP